MELSLSLPEDHVVDEPGAEHRASATMRDALALSTTQAPYVGVKLTLKYHETVPAVPVAVPGRTVPMVPVSGSSSGPGPPLNRRGDLQNVIKQKVSHRPPWSHSSQGVRRGGLSLRGVAFMTVLAVLESTLPSFCLS